MYVSWVTYTFQNSNILSCLQSVLVGDSDGQISVFLLTGISKRDIAEVKILGVFVDHAVSLSS